MGLAGARRPPLPAPTDSLSGFEGAGDESPDEGASPYLHPPPLFAPSDVETNLTTHTDRTSYSIPEDGSPVTLNTTKKTTPREGDPVPTPKPKGKSTKSTDKGHLKGQRSQTSLLIEYFEGDRDGSESGTSRRPSVRVRVTPSRQGKEGAGTGAREVGEGVASGSSVRITKRNSRKPTYTQHIDLDKDREGFGQVEESNLSSLGSDLSDDRPPVEVEVRNMADGGVLSRLSAAEESRLAPINMSEVSAMPPDSMLDSGLDSHSSSKLSRRRSRSLERTPQQEREEEERLDTLKVKPQRSRSLSRERMVARKAVEKFEREHRERRHKEKEREQKRLSGSSSGSKSKSRSASKEYTSESKPRRKSSRSYDKEETVSGVDHSLLTGSGVSGYSGASGESTASSIKNPKLLQTVEDAIRRLILPEINALKNEQKSHRRSDRYDDVTSSPASSIRSDERSSSRRVSSGKGPKLKLNGDTIKSTKSSSRRSIGKEMADSPEREFERGVSEETVIRDDKSSRRRSKDKSRDAAAGAAVTGLTYAALKSKESGSSLERRERRKRRVKDHSRTSSRTESRTDSRAESRPESRTASVEEIFEKHNVPPMPMNSDLTSSDKTRDSILSERTSTPTHERNREVRELIHDPSKELEFSPGGSITPTRDRTPDHLHGIYDSVHLKREPPHGGYLDEYDEYEDEEEGEVYYNDTLPAEPYAHERGYMSSYSGPEYHSPPYDFPRRNLSPIQSVASYEERGEPPPSMPRSSLHHTQSSTSVSSAARDVHQERSMDSVPSNIVRGAEHLSHRPRSVNFETARETLHGHQSPVSKVIGGRLGQDIREVGANPEYVGTPHGVESAVASLMEPSTVGGQSNMSGGSELSGKPSRHSLDAERRLASPMRERDLYTPDRGSPLKREVQVNDMDDRMDVDSPSYRYQYQRPPAHTPSRERQMGSTNSSPFIEKPLGHSAMPSANSPMPDAGAWEDEDDIETNPSPIQGPGQHSKANSAQNSLRAAADNFLSAAAGMGAGAALMQTQRDPHGAARHEDDYPSPPQTDSSSLGDVIRKEPESPLHGKTDTQEPGEFTPFQPDYSPLPPFKKDEAYESGGIPGVFKEGSITPDYRHSKAMDRSDGLFNTEKGMDLNPGDVYASDPFTAMPKKQRPISGHSDAMPDPLFDAATGRGMDRIQNKDIVALMDHLTVRDAQRSARDTEILVTLVRSAAEMRNSFDDMKRFISTQDQQAVAANAQQHEATRKVIAGPRAMPSKTLSRTTATDDAMIEDLPAKKKNVFRRALQGLSGGNKQDLGKIEDLLMQLLDEVADIKAAQVPQSAGGMQPAAAAPLRSSGLTSYEQLRDVPVGGVAEAAQPSVPKGFSAEPRNDSGYSSANSSYKPVAAAYGRRGSEALRTSQNRVSTVEEDENEDEELLDETEQRILGNEHADEMLTPTRDFRGGEFQKSGAAVPQTSVGQGAVASTEATPNNRRNRSGSSGFFQKISRWSKTTASTIPGLEHTPTQPQRDRQQQRPVSELSRSVSDLGDGDGYDVRDHYDPHGDDRIRSKTSLSNRSKATTADRPPSPLIPSHVSEKPTYSAHRDSLNLQHPQPSRGLTDLYQTHLESEALRAWMPSNEEAESPSSDVMGNNPVLSRYTGGGGTGAGNRYSGGSYGLGGDLGTIDEVSGVGSNTTGPPLPPKVKDEGPLVPSKIPIEEGGKSVSFVDRMMGGDNRANFKTEMPQRKPTGPRPITSSGSYSPKGLEKEGYKVNQYYQQQPHRLSDHVPSSPESETF